MAEATPAIAEPIASTSGVSGSPVAMLVVDDDCRVAEVSLEACRVLGLCREEILLRPLAELLSPAAADRLAGVWTAFHETGGHAGPFELAWPRDAAPIDISVTAAVLPGRHLILLTGSDVFPSSSGLAAGTPPRRDSGGWRGPTSRERQILSMLTTGDTDVQIARKLDLSPATVQTHVRNAKAKLRARTRAQAVAMALRQGIIHG